jgi:hypothetical protein
MAQYRVTETSYLDGRIIAEGDTVTVSDDTIPGPHMLPLDDAAKKAAKDIKPGKIDPVEDLAKSDRRI